MNIYNPLVFPNRVWTVRYNSYHEQLLLTGSSDARALLTAAASVCSQLDDEGARLSKV